MGALSVMLVVVAVTLVVGLIGAAGVSFGIAIAGLAAGRAWHWTVIGGAAGGMLTGAAVKMLGLDAFALLIGHAPAGITGAAEGVALGAAVGLGAWLAGPRTGPRSLRLGSMKAALAGGTAGAAITLLGGKLTRNPGSGLGVTNGADATVVEWPFRYGAVEVDGRVALLDETGKIVAREGDEINVGGGFGNQFWHACGPVTVTKAAS